MEYRRTTATATIALLGLAALFVVVGVGAPAVLAQETNETTDDEASFGAQMSAFAQSSAADANATVDAGMWRAQVNNSEQPGNAVDARAATLERRLQRLENRTRDLEAARANGTISGVAYTARASAIHAQLANLQKHVNDTTQVARDVGVNETKLAQLRQAAGNATGPEIAAIARNLTDHGPPNWAGDRGNGQANDPPGHAGNNTAGPAGNNTGNQAGNNTGAPDGNQTGSPADGAGGGSGNGPDAGPSGSGGGPDNPNRPLLDPVRVH